MRKAILFLLFILMILCIFDSRDLFLGLKMPVFVCLIVVTLLYAISASKLIDEYLIRYFFFFSIFIPLFSLSVAIVRNNLSFEEIVFIDYLKPYLFLLLVFVLYISNFDLIRPTVSLLTLLSICSIAIFFTVLPSQELFLIFYAFTEKYEFLALGTRPYGGIDFPFIYFHTTPLLVIPICYFSYQIFSKNDTKWAIVGLLINLFGMFLSGTRNNIFMGIFACSITCFYYMSQKAKVLFLIVSSCVMLSVAVALTPILSDMFSVTETSNSIKLGHYESYLQEFRDWRTLVFGEGIGSIFYSSGVKDKVSITELTYFEILRRFGFFLTVIIAGLMIYPLTAIKRENGKFAWLFLSYACYLIMIAFNPFFFSSTGMIILSIVLNKQVQLRNKSIFSEFLNN